jgi:L-ascorbate metabolism protein UlaG (beta-lactamase superfamily)
MIDGLHWLGHDTFRIDASSCCVYIDPWKLPAGSPPADVILVTHDHFDHFSQEDIGRIARPGTVVVGPAPVTECLAGDERLVLHTLAAGQSTTAGAVIVTAVPAYNTNKFSRPGEHFHPREAGYLGYVVEVDDRRIYHAGDTDVIPEMGGVVCDIALLPVGGTYTMTANEAADACDLLRAELVVPMHYGDIVGGIKDAQRFAELCRLPVKLLPVERW